MTDRRRAAPFRQPTRRVAAAIFVAAGEVEVWHSDGLSERVVLVAGDYICIPPDTPHLPVNWNDQEMIAVVARTDPDEQEGVHLIDLPEHLHGSVAEVPVAAPSRLGRRHRAPVPRSSIG
ncbi:cupin domain-containing protein [Streptomyces sp. NPDC050619]|uniref:cupin domain-containing protein n=1 Tax=Streptomyces sp. NPDC050619 TaxID=3157214 RepID=UPI003433AD43